MKTQHILLIVGVVVLAVLVARLQRPPVSPETVPTSQSVAMDNQGQTSVLRQTDAGQGTPVADAAGSAGQDEAPAKPAITVRTDVRRQSSREVSIGLVLAGANGQNLPVTSVVRSPQPPGLRIVNEAGQVVGQGNFSYGWGGTCRYTWRVPNDFTGKFQVQVDIDLGSAEAKHERPWHSL